MRFFILDYGRDLIEYAHGISERIRKDGHHIIEYFTDADGLMCLEEISEDEFLDHFKKVEQHYKNTN
jgi:hypothetical protein